MKCKSIALAAAVAACVSPSIGVGQTTLQPAVVEDWGSHALLRQEQSGSELSRGPFDHVFLFDIADTFLASAGVNPLAFLQPTYTIGGGKVELFKSDNDTTFAGDSGDTSVGAFDFGSTANSGQFGKITAGEYFYRVTGVATGNSGGLYTISSSMSPTPEPGTFAMLLAGLGVVGFLSRRRLPR